MDHEHAKFSHALGRARRSPFVLLSLGIALFALAGCGPKNPETFKLKSGKGIERFVKFQEGANVQIWVESEQDSDVDLFVFDSSNTEIAKDDGPSKNCYVTFKPASTQTYKIQVQNRVLMGAGAPLHRNVDNRCTLKWEPKQ